MSDIVRAALVQSEWTGDKESMVDKSVDLARQAADQGAQVLCFQENLQHSLFLQRPGLPSLRRRRRDPSRSDDATDDQTLRRDRNGPCCPDLRAR